MVNGGLWKIQVGVKRIGKTMNEKIISKVYSAQGRENYDNIFKKKNAYEWCEELYGRRDIILNPDGFRGHDGVTMDTPISKKEFERRFNHCTVNHLAVSKFKKESPDANYTGHKCPVCGGKGRQRQGVYFDTQNICHSCYFVWDN